MLLAADCDRVRDGFRVYEHEWKYFASFLGEPFLIDDYLVYWDGGVINFPAFSLFDPRVLDSDAVSRVISRLPSVSGAEVAFVWGEVELGNYLQLPGGGERFLLGVSIDSAEHAGEFTLSPESFDLGRLKEARKAVRSVARKGIMVESRRLDHFEHNHFRLVEEWVKTRPIGAIATCATSTLPFYCRESHVRVFEIYNNEPRMVAFAILSMPVSDRAVLMWSFSERSPGARLEDALMHAIISYCQSNAIAVLHCGYAGSSSLARFKSKWGAKQTAPNYRLGMYASAGEWSDRAERGRFYWAIRISNQAVVNEQALADKLDV